MLLGCVTLSGETRKMDSVEECEVVVLREVVVGPVVTGN